MMICERTEMTTTEELSRGIELVSHDVRAGILLALAEHQQEAPRDETLRFAELRKRVGHDDPGNFNYHLKRQQGTLVEKTDEAYRLSDIGHHFIALLISGQFDPDSTREIPDPDIDCPICETPVTVTYEDGMLRTECENGHGTGMNVGPEILDSHSVAGALNVAMRRTLWEARSTMDGVCPQCEGTTTGTVNLASGESVPVFYEWVCTTCGAFLQNTAGGCALFHPAVVSFCYQRGVDVYQDAWTTFVGNVGTATVRSEEPLRVQVAVSVEGDSLVLTLDENASVVDITEQPS
jgi:hypothetical protein